VLEALDRLVRELDRGRPPGDLAGQAPAVLRPVVEALARRWPAPRESLLALRRVVEARGTDGWPARPTGLRSWSEGGQSIQFADALASLLSSGPELPRLLARDPRRLERLADPDLGREWSRQELEHDLQGGIAAVDPDDEAAFAERLTAFRNDHYVRLAACEFLLPTLEQVGRELATLADVCLERAMAFAEAGLARAHGAPRVDGAGACRLCALAMGKHGARELNFCSDVDLIFIYTSDEGAAGSLSLHEFFTRVCQQVTRILSEPNREGHVFRVDLRLRPEGSRGPICNSLAGAERYYETWGGPYDRLAWLKARSAAGDLELGRQMIRILRPFVFPRSIQPEVVDQIQELYRRVNAELQGSTGGWNVKLGPGGIRQIEFLVQALQLLHAGKHDVLQERATLRALDKLLFLGLITGLEHRRLAEAYELWRRVEHRLQLYDGRQTHLLPDRGPLRERVAVHLGREPAAFDLELSQRRDEVRAIYDTLASAGETTGDGGPTPLALPQREGPPLSPLLDRDLPRARRADLLREAGFDDVERAADELELLASRPWGPLGHTPHPAARRLGLPLLEELVRSPDPDAALQHTVALTLRHGPYQGLWELLDHNRSTLRLLISLFGSSDHLARMFVEHPELMDQLLGVGRAQATREIETLERDLMARLTEVDDADTEARLNILRRFQSEEVLRIGLHDIASDLDLESGWRQLTDLAQVILQQTYPLVLCEATSRYGRPRRPDGAEASMAVLGLGKLGSGELSYGSDLDLIFVFSDAGATDGRRPVENSEFFARLAQRLIGALGTTLDEGRLYQVDPRLRPSGNQGTLVVSWPAFREYHEGAAELWERQVLIKTRAVAGDLDLGRAVERWVERYVYDSPLDADLLRREMDRHRRRMEKELAGENGDFYNLKFGPGGLLDIDFIAQYFQLRHGREHPSLRVRSTLPALASLGEEGLIDPDSAVVLARGYRFLRRIENRIRIVRDRSAERLPGRAQGLEVMARRLGYRRQLDATPGSRLLAQYRETTESIRGIYERIFGE